MASANRLAASRREADEAARELALITEMSREITSTLDLDRVLRTVVNLAAKAFTFDRGAVALYEHGVCDIRAVAGADGVDAKDSALQDLAVRAAWAAGLGESFYLSERTDPGSDAERTFVQIFGEDLERDGAMSGLYLPLKDEEGIVGILLFEADRSDFATPRERELAAILANQSTVAVRNARLYHQVPLANALGAFGAKREAFLELPRAPARHLRRHRHRDARAAHAGSLADARRRLRAACSVPSSAPTFAPRSPASSIACSCARECSSSAARRSRTCATTSVAPSGTPPLPRSSRRSARRPSPPRAATPPRSDSSVSASTCSAATWTCSTSSCGRASSARRCGA